jgi:hypothetical protein
MLTVLLLPACGVVFSARFEGTEVFRELDLESESGMTTDFPAASTISVTLTLKQSYPVPLAISCGYEDVDISDDERKVAFNERALIVFGTLLPANPESSPADHKEQSPQVLNLEFSVPDPGDYFFACFTPAAPENGIGQGFTVTES